MYSQDRGGTAIRHCIRLKSILPLVPLFFLMCADASALVQSESYGITFSFPAGEDAIVSRLVQQTPRILDFLDQQGLPAATPVQVILDDGLDLPEAMVHVIPHREIRIPLRAPGVLEDGYLEADPWMYFYFKGLCLLGMYSLRSGLPAQAHNLLGEISSPNVILPPWFFEGTCALLYSSYTGTLHRDPYSEALFATSIPGDISRVSNHPGQWPGYFAYRIYGVPFMAWIHSRYGWEKIREFLRIHGGGVIPIEIDLKAMKVFGKTWPGLWADFLKETPCQASDRQGVAVDGYWPDPLIYWNTSGISTGRKKVQLKGRYGYPDSRHTLWISVYEQDGTARLKGYRGGMTLEPRQEHIWDPAPGGVAVTRKGSRPYIVFFAVEESSLSTRITIQREIPAPDGATQLSGPVISDSGQVAVSANIGGNWDIWVYDTSWKRVSDSVSVEMDPWWKEGGLVFSSNAGGSFQILRADKTVAARSGQGAVLPRGNSYLGLGDIGWLVERGQFEGAPASFVDPPTYYPEALGTRIEPGPYSPWTSILPDFIAPDFYAGPSDVQAGLATWGRDVSGDYTMRAGFRYSLDLDYLSLQADSGIRNFSLAFARYPLVYDPENTPQTEESRHEISLGVRPPGMPWVSLSLHRLTFEPLEDEDEGGQDHELWGGLSLTGRIGPFTPGLTAEAYSGGRRSLYGSVRFVYGKDLFLAALLQAGKSWGEVSPGHGTFRVGGDVGEGYFTRRPSRLFPVRGFPPNILEAGKAVTSSFEVFCPLAEIQRGHKTLPLFLHRLSIGGFFDAGVCSDTLSRDQVLAGAGFEIITSMEIAWGNLSAFKAGVAWPVSQPEYLDEEGPVFVLQIGRPL